MQNVCRRYGDPRPGSGPPGLYGLPVIHVATTSGRWGDDRAPQSRLPTGRTVHLTYQNRPGQTLAAAALVLRLLCQTAAVAFDNADFWLVAGTAAPVVALATVVSLGEALREGANTAAEAAQAFHDLGVTETEAEAFRAKALADRRPVPELTSEQFRKHSNEVWLRLVWVGLANLILQGALLAVSLVSLTDGANLVPPWIAIVAAVGGLLLLAIGALGAARLRMMTMIAHFRKVPREGV